MTSIQDVRKVSLHERFTLMRRNTGHPVIMGFILTYPTSADLPSIAFLHERVKAMQAHFPMLWATVRGARTVTPSFEAREGRPWEGEDLVREVEAEVKGKDDEATLLKQELKRVALQDPVKRPLWQITLQRSAPAQYPTAHKTPLAHLIFTIDHVLTDGVGALRILQLLLSPTLPPTLPRERLREIPLFEETIDIRPSYAHLLPIAFRELLLPILKPYLPAFIMDLFLAVETWPGENVYRSPLEVEADAWDQVGLTIDPVISAALKVKTKQFAGAKGTLHPVLIIVWSIAIWAEHKSFASYNGGKGSKAGDSELDGTSSSATGVAEAFHFEAGTPKNERSPTLRHGHVTGNYTSAHTYHGSIRPESSFWDLVRDLSYELKSPKGIRMTRGGMGMLAFVPDGQIETFQVEDDEIKEDAAALRSRNPTKWEEFFLAKAGSSKPISTAVSISNLGQTSLTSFPGATDLSWSLPANPYGPVLFLSAVTHEKGMNFVAAWIEGVVLRKEEVERVVEMVRVILHRLAEGGHAGVTAAELAKVE